MIVDHSYLLQKGIRDFLDTSQDLKNLLGDPLRIYEEVPVSNDNMLATEFPYIQYMDASVEDNSGNTCKVLIHTLNFDIWDGDDYEGTARASKIAALINQLLDNNEAPIVVAPIRLVILQFVNKLVLQSQDGQAWLVRLTYQAYTENNNG
jgi:hypothetical protein